MTKIIIAGATGNLGEKIVHSLLGQGAEVCAIVRANTPAEKIQKLTKLGVKVSEVDMTSPGEISKACAGASCAISALQGLHDVIVDVQKAFLDAAVAAKVARFIPSDFSLDFTKLPKGENRNFDLRREFHQLLEKAPIAATSIYNGPFAEILSYNIPVLDMKKKMVGYWGNDADWHLDFTTMDDTAAYTAAAALDASAPKALRIASFQVSPKQLAALASEITGAPFNLVPMGSIEKFAEHNRRERAANPEGEKELYPRWQSGQYMHDMFCTHHETLDNGRYPNLTWTSARQFLSSLLG